MFTLTASFYWLTEWQLVNDMNRDQQHRVWTTFIKCQYCWQDQTAAFFFLCFKTDSSIYFYHSSAWVTWGELHKFILSLLFIQFEKESGMTDLDQIQEDKKHTLWRCQSQNNQQASQAIEAIFCFTYIIILRESASNEVVWPDRSLNP